MLAGSLWSGSVLCGSKFLGTTAGYGAGCQLQGRGELQ
jgi:hypothetical protein